MLDCQRTVVTRCVFDFVARDASCEVDVCLNVDCLKSSVWGVSGRQGEAAANSMAIS
jgi:hypothetical protein